MNRRQILTTAGALAAGACASSADAVSAAGPDPATRRTFVLLHGTWHGGWVWRDVRNLLEDQGHRVFTPTLTGCGERAHLSSPEISLETHITDIANVLAFEELEDVVLVGHSFTGVAMTGAVDRMRERIRHLVFFDALVPTETRRAAVPRDDDGELPDWFKARMANFEDGYNMVLWEDYPVDMLVPPEARKPTAFAG